MNNERVGKKIFVISSVLFLALLLFLQAGLLAQAKKKVKPNFKQKTTDFSKKAHALLLLPDLAVNIKCSERAYPGQPLKEILKVFVTNQGKKVAENFFVEVVSSKKTTTPVLKPDYSHINYGATLRKLGREKIMKLNLGQTISVNFGDSIRIPLDVQLVTLYLGAVVDSDKIIRESRENNNVARCRVQILMLISNVRQLQHGYPIGEMDIQGYGFGSDSTNKVVYVGTQPMAQMLYWGPTMVSIVPPSGLNGGQYYPIKIKQGAQTISNVYNYLCLRYFEGADPMEGAAGTLVTLYGFKFGATQGTNVLKIGNTVVNTIVSWSSTIIKFNVPQNAPVGSHQIYIMEGLKLVSNKVYFKVL